MVMLVVPSMSVDPPKSVLKVNVPAELEGIAFIQVVIQKESEQLVSANICQSGTFDPSLVNIFSQHGHGQSEKKNKETTQMNPQH